MGCLPGWRNGKGGSKADPGALCPGSRHVLCRTAGEPGAGGWGRGWEQLWGPRGGSPCSGLCSDFCRPHGPQLLREVPEMVCFHTWEGTPAPWGQIPWACKLPRLGQEETQPESLAHGLWRRTPHPDTAGPGSLASSPTPKEGPPAVLPSPSTMEARSRRQDGQTEQAHPARHGARGPQVSADPGTTLCPERLRTKGASVRNAGFHSENRPVQLAGFPSRRGENGSHHHRAEASDKIQRPFLMVLFPANWEEKESSLVNSTCRNPTANTTPAARAVLWPARQEQDRDICSLLTAERGAGGLAGAVREKREIKSICIGKGKTRLTLFGTT